MATHRDGGAAGGLRALDSPATYPVECLAVLRERQRAAVALVRQREGLGG